ncbi:MAG: glycosyltransferase family 4 protein [Bacilli bacterium]
MKILVVSQFYYPENFIITNLCESFVKEGHDVTVLTGKPNYGYDKIIDEYKKIKYEEINGVKVHRVNLYPRHRSRLSIIRNYLSYWMNAKRFVRKHKEMKFDVVFSMSLSPVTILAPANLYKKIHKVPHLVYCVDLWPESTIVTHAVRKDSLVYKILYKWSQLLYQKADKVLISSPSFEKYLRDILKINCPIEVCYQPSIIENHEEIIPTKLNDGFNIVYCGNIGSIQWMENVPEIMSLVKNKNIYFHIIGMGPKSELLKENIKKYHVENNVIYHGPIIAKVASGYLLSADLLYVSLLADGYVGQTIPNKLNFYMTFKKPIFGVIKGDGLTALKQSGNNFYSEFNVNDIANKIDEIALMDKKELETIGESNYQYYLSNYCLKTASNKIISSLKEIVNK